MKKALLAIALVGGMFALSSCAKNCNCEGKYNGDVVISSTTELEKGNKCSDYNYRGSFLGQTIEVKCTPELF